MSAEPTTPKGRRTRDHLVNAGRVVFARDGYVSARMSDVAQEAEISMGGLYRYFANKEDLFGQVIADLHEELFQASTATDHDFKTDPYEALVESNKGYLRHYSEQRDVMRAFIQAAHVEDRFRDFWWKMRNRHIDRFVTALKNVHGITEVNGVDAALAAESVACMVEQSAYVWYAQHKLHGSEVDLDDAARTVAHTWFVTFFGPDDHRVASS
ncbi:TetR family transcriptional regulator [Nocardioides sp. Root151]|nr:TetR family transcriptional regulator [Nocardioides sp. Root140]KQZ66310.1 TetR family transcriptional regulator [Nocardioides sp. Root151]KRF19511.1 TetR family transcriptional regulator [Nocardioides sp. Soil796]